MDAEMPTKLTPETITGPVKVILRDLFEVEEEALKPDALLGKDLGLDSLDGVDLIVALEKSFKCRIAEDKARKITTLQEVYDAVEDRLAEIKESGA